MKPTFVSLFAITAATLLSGCGASPTAPVSPSGATTSARRAEVPDFSNVVVRYADGLLHVAAIPAGPDGAFAPFDGEHAGGWCFQLFIDADQSGSGYGSGIDYLVRAIEVAPGGAVDVRRADGGGGPGGWGERVGRVGLGVNGGQIECAVPLWILGPDDGAINFVLETYRTIELPASKGGGVKHEFVANYSGVSVPFARDARPARRGLVAVAPLAERAR